MWLEDLSAVAPAVWQLGDVGMLPAEEVAPWTVGIHELELICSLAERPAQLVHYVLWRLRTYRQRVWASDEMDFWMRYLSRGLWWENETLVERSVQLLSHTDPLDAWAYGGRGLRPKAPRPRQKLDAATRRVLDAIEATDADGRIEAQLMLLEMSSDTRRTVTSTLRSLARETQRDGLVHDRTSVFSDDLAITTQSVRPGEEELELLADYGGAKMKQLRLRRWLGCAHTLERRSGWWAWSC